MADENNPSGQEENGASNGNPPASKAPDGSSKPEISSEEQARRAEQSEKDKQAGKEDDSLRQDVDYLRAKEAERARDSFVTDLLSDKDKYPNVDPNDKLFKYAASKEEVEEIATELQNKFTDLQQNALRSVQTESEQSLTDEEIAQKEVELAKEAEESGRSTFGNFMDNLGRRKKA